MSEMVERVAAALLFHKIFTPAAGDHELALMTIQETRGTPRWDQLTKRARIAIATMMEPTEAMVNAACGDELPIEALKILRHAWRQTWREAIKAALEPSVPRYEDAPAETENT
jgi:hypothetical protein